MWADKGSRKGKKYVTLKDMRSAIKDHEEFKKLRKVELVTFLLVCFLGLNESTCQTSEISQTCFSSSSISVKKKF